MEEWIIEVRKEEWGETDEAEKLTPNTWPDLEHAELGCLLEPEHRRHDREDWASDQARPDPSADETLHVAP
jgi:hypothetical protein